VTAAIICLLAGVEPLVEVDKAGKPKDKSWKAAVRLMNNPEYFLRNLMSFKEKIDTIQVPH